MIDESTYNELDRYVSGDMRGDERSSFEAQLSSNAALREELSWIQSTIAAMQFNGRTVMKQHVAATFATISDREIEKYFPSKNAPSFWQRWWWVIMIGGIVLIAVALFLYYALHMNQHDERSRDVHEGSIVTLNNDSLIAAMTRDVNIPENQSADVSIPINETVSVKPIQKADSIKTKVQDVRDSVKSPYYLVWAESEIKKEEPRKQEPLHVVLNVLVAPPFTYKLDSLLILNSKYTSAKQFTFSGQGDTVYMTDTESNTYMLLRGKGERPLKKMATFSK